MKRGSKITFFGGNGDVGPVEITGKMCEKGVKIMFFGGNEFSGGIQKIIEEDSIRGQSNWNC